MSVLLAPVSGGQAGEKWTITIMVGGDEEVYNTVKPNT